MRYDACSMNRNRQPQGRTNPRFNLLIISEFRTEARIMTLSSRFFSAIAVGFTLVQPALAEPAQPPPSGKYWVYIGTYTSKDGGQGIYRCELDMKSGFDMNSGYLSAAIAVAELADPS